MSFKIASAISILIFSTSALSSQQTRSFAEAYKEMMARSLRIDTQTLEVQASEARKLGAKSAFLPTLSAGLTDSRYGEPYTGPAQGAGLTLAANLFHSGADLSGVQAANQNLASQNEKLKSERQMAERESIETLINFIARVRERQINEKILDIRSESLKIAKERYAKGLLPMQEVDTISIDLENARASLIDALTQEATARSKLKAFLGDDRVAIDWPWREPLTQGAQLEKEELKLEIRPDWRSLNFSLEEGRFKERQAFRSLLPSLDLSVSYGSADLSVGNRRDWKTLLTFSVPLFSGFKDYAAYRVSALATLQSAYQLEALRREAPAEVESLRSQYRMARESALAREATSKVSERLYKDNMQRFRLGRASVNDLAIDQNRVLQSQLHEVEGWSTAHLTFARLCHALGGYVFEKGSCDRLN